MSATAEVLVIDDDDDFRESCVDLLTQSGLRVEALSDAGVALEQLRGRDRLPAVIVVDLMMAEMDGWAFCETQRSDPRLVALPVLVVSASSIGPTQMPTGVSFLSKLVEPALLIAAVSRLARP